MSDNLGTLLRDAGDLLDEWAEARGIGEVPNAAGRSDDVPVYVLDVPPETGGDHAWSTGRVRLFATAAVILVVALAAAAAIALPGGGDDAPAVARSIGPIVALVPTTVEGVLEADERAFTVGRGTPAVDQVQEEVIVGWPDAADAPERTIRIRRMVDGYKGPVAHEEGTRSGLTGWLDESAPDGRVNLTLDMVDGAGSDVQVHLITGAGVTADELADVAAQLDLDVPLADQELDGMQVMADSDRAVSGAMVRHWWGHDRRYQGVTITGPSEDVLWFTDDSFLSSVVEVRGMTGYLRHGEEQSRLTWVESPGVTVQLSWSEPGSTPDERLALLLAAAEDLVAVDAAGWERFLEELSGDDSPPLEGDVDTTTTTPPPTTTTTERHPSAHFMATFDHQARLEQARASERVLMEWSLPNGQPFFVEDAGEDVLCIRIQGIPLDCDAGVGVDGNSDGPRLAIDPSRADDHPNRLLAVYGYHPADVVTVLLELDGEVVRGTAGMSTRADLWVIPIDPDTRFDAIVYVDRNHGEPRRYDVSGH